MIHAATEQESLEQVVRETFAEKSKIAKRVLGHLLVPGYSFVEARKYERNQHDCNSSFDPDTCDSCDMIGAAFIWDLAKLSGCAYLAFNMYYRFTN